MPIENIPGNSPVILALPYTGTNIQRAIAHRLQDESLCFTVPDRYLDRLMSDLHPDVSRLRANFHRYLSDVDHPQPAQDDQPARGMMGVVPLIDHDGKSIWHTPPSKKEAASWRAMYHVPYHAALAAHVARARAQFGYAVLVTCRAIRADKPDGSGMPSHIGLATYLGAPDMIDLGARLNALFAATATHTSSLNGRAKAGWSTRHYGRPSTGVHAFDLVIREDTYLEFDNQEPHYRAEAAATLQDALKEALGLLVRWRPRG